MIDDRSMRNISFCAREKLLPKFNLNMGNNPLPTEDSQTINLTMHERVTLKCARPDSSCFRDCIQYLLTGKPQKSTHLQAELIKQQGEQSYGYQSFCFPSFNPKQSLLNQRIVETNLYVLAQLGLNSNSAQNKTTQDGYM